MAFDLDFLDKQADIKAHVRKFFLYPDYWENPKNQLPVKLKWKKCLFSPQNRDHVPKKSGIYCFVLCPYYSNFFNVRYLFYAGKTDRTLWVRYKEYLNEREGKGKPRPKVYEMLNRYDGKLYFYYATINDLNAVKTSEDALINAFVPPINAQVPDAKIKPELKYIYE